MRDFGFWLRERPIRLMELCSAVVLIVAAVISDTFVKAAFRYSLAALLLIVLLYSFLNQDRPS